MLTWYPVALLDCRMLRSSMFRPPFTVTQARFTLISFPKFQDPLTWQQIIWSDEANYLFSHPNCDIAGHEDPKEENT